MTSPIEQGLEAEMELRRRLLRHLIANWDEALIHTATDGFQDLLFDAHDGMLEALLQPLVEWPDFWPQRMAAEVLGLDLDEEYDTRELLDLFDRRTEVSGPEASSESSWKEAGF